MGDLMGDTVEHSLVKEEMVTFPMQGTRYRFEAFINARRDERM